jgi:hypothetical protein
MKNVPFPLAIAFAGDDGVILRIAHMKPQRTDTTPSLYPIRYALEVNDGWFTSHGVEVGDRLTGLPDVKPE